MYRVLQVALVACLLAPSVGYYFESGYSHRYTYWAENTLFDQHNVTTVLKFQVNAINQTEEGQRLHSLTVDSLVQYVKDGVLLNNPKQWDLGKSFLFVSDDKGSVTLVHCHPEDHEELLVIKKAMVGVFSVHVQIEEEKERWNYTVSEQDHLGSLTHDYTVYRQTAGLRLHRKHHSSQDAFRTHEKTLHYDHQGTLHTAEAFDYLMLRDRSQKETITKMAGEKPHNIHVSGDFPIIEARATVKLTLDEKRSWSKSAQDVFDNLTAQTLEIKLKPEVTYQLEAVRQNISRVFHCLKQFPEKDHENRSICVNNLRDILRNLQEKDYHQFVNSILGNRCQTNDTECEDKRLVLIDVIGRLGDVTSQDLLITHVLSRYPAVDEELRRAFIHCVALEQPAQRFIQWVERFCFGAEGEHHGSRAMTRTQSRACLAVGSLARHSHRAGQQHTTDRLLDRLESWLDRHAEGDPHISKRDTWLEETEHEDHHISKAVLLHALGNAAMPRSRRHLLLHATPNRGHQLWRRAALDAMRHYHCDETARALLDCLLHDDKHTVRQMALSVYVKHPRRHEVLRDQENIKLSQDYTYPAVARVKRDLLNDVLFKFKLALPPVDWKKELGTKDVGASFGVYCNNGIDGFFRVLNGYIDLSVHDKLWAEIHLGLIGKQWDLLLIEVCYRGRLSYNMNIVKDFTVGMMEDISSAFDHIASKLIEPMEKVANDLASRYQDKVTNAPKSGFQSVANAVKELPKTTETALKSTTDLSDVAEHVSNLPLVTKLQQLAARAQSLMEDVHNEATDLFASIKDAAVVALPFAEKEIRNSLNIVLDKLGQVSQAPRQTFFFIERASLGFQLAMQRILEGNNIIKQATAFLSGSRSSFMNVGQELLEIAESTRRLVQRLRADVSRRKRQADQGEDNRETVEAGLNRVLDDLLSKAEAMASQLENTTSSSRDLQHGLDQQVLYIEVLKSGYQAFKEAIDMVKSRISALFGQKFYPGFPDQQRDCDDRCKCGYYPTDCNRYGHPGVDLKWDQGWKIPSPVAGMATPVGNNSLSIKPSSAGFTDYEIILSNIRVIANISSTGTFVDAGQIVGESAGQNGCEDPHFHLAMKRHAPDSDSGLCYYVDPSPFLDRMQPVPRWQQECKHFTFKHIGDVVDFDKLTEGFSEILKELKRFALDVGKNLLLKKIGELPDSGFMGALKDIAGDILKNIDLDPANIGNLLLTAKSGGMKSFFNNIGTKNFSLQKMLTMVTKSNGSSGNNRLSSGLNKVAGYIDKARAIIQRPPLGGLNSLATGGISRLLSTSRGRSTSQGRPGTNQGSPGANLGTLGAVVAGFALGTTVAGGRAGMITSFKTKALDACPKLGGRAVTGAAGSSCAPDLNCLGMRCVVPLRDSAVTETFDFSVTVNLQQRKLTIMANGSVQDISGQGSKSVRLQQKVLQKYDVRLQVETTWEGGVPRFSLTVLACSSERCLPKVPVIRNAIFEVIAEWSSSVNRIMDNSEQLPLDDITKMFSDVNLPIDDVVEQITGIQDQISDAMETSKVQTEPTMTAEFTKPTDFKDSGRFPLQAENGEIYLPFFRFLYTYPLGPVIFIVEFDAGGALGVSFNVEVLAIDSLLRTEIKPWVSAKFRASMSISIVVASAGMELIGWVMKTGFPLSLTTNYNKQPVVSRKALEVELIPIELKLAFWVKILFIINTNKIIWHYTAPALRDTIWEKIERKDDQGPPRFPFCDRACSNGRRRRQIRSAGSSCSVHQIKGRHPKDAAFKLEFSVEDEDSDLQLSYAVGDYPGGTNVLDWTTMRGSSLLSPAELPCGSPLYFLVKARNSQGLETTAQCSIPTFDCTFPDGRVDAAYRCSSHTRTLKSQVILFEDSQLETDQLYHGVGYSPSSFGHEVVDWQPLQLSNSMPLSGVSGDLRHFSSPRPGRLSVSPKKSTKADAASQCASECIKLSTCVTFVYNQYLHDCELYEVTEGARAERKPDRFYQTYERIGKSYTATLSYDNLQLRHGTKYYVNADIVNVLGYRATLTSQGTLVDMTPPEPGPIGEVIADNITADGCDASIIQRCDDHLPNSLNHRRIIDGANSRTVFSGNRKGQEMAFTIENYQAAANWDGFKDEECGIHGYTWSVGTTVCGSDVASFVNPHRSVSNPDDWSYTGLAKDLHLRDGPYYVTVQAVSDVIHGGDLVTTVCHSRPFVVDTSPPIFHAVEDFLFDESFRFLVVYYNVSDTMSGIARMEFGLGKTKYDVEIRRYLPFEMRGVEGNTYLVNEEFETQDGIPAWIRLKVVNNVGLSAYGSSISPILLDSSPPVVGHVMDGAELGQDVCCQMSTTKLCAQWMDFHDPESSIDSYDWGVGLTPGTDNVVTFHSLSSYDKQSCVNVTLLHNVTYFSTVVANNRALNQKSANISSDGLLVDVTPPIAGIVSDGDNITNDVNYTSETATVTTSWAGFYDPESGLADYTVIVNVNSKVEKSFPGLSDSLEMFSDHSFSLQHGDSILVQLRAKNRAGGQTVMTTDGILVDHTPPELIGISTADGSLYLLQDHTLDFVWDFRDPESGVSEYRCVIIQLYHGQRTRVWPELTDFYPITLNKSSPTAEQLRLDSLSLQNGASYSVKVTAINGAKMASAEESEAVTVDTTPPVVLKVSLAREGEEEETNDDNQVEHVDSEPLWVQWSAHDSESGIVSTHLCVGPSGVPDCLSSNQYLTVNGSLSFITALHDLNLQVSTDEHTVLYQVYLVVFNGAGVQSIIDSSKPFLVLKANIAGVVLDGRGTEDVDFSLDKSSIAITFSGFSSEACGIVGYEWGVGTSSFATDMLSYTDYGLVVDEVGNGFAQVHIMQSEGQKYYSTVRAKTGHNCHEEYIVSSSDGFTTDTTSPTVTYFVGTHQLMSEEVVYQSTSERLDVLWLAEDPSGLNQTRLIQNVFVTNAQVVQVPAAPKDSLTFRSRPVAGTSTFLALIVTDNAGNEKMSLFPPVTFDFTEPSFITLNCSRSVSYLSSVLTCSWHTVEEWHSSLLEIQIGLGNGPSVADLMKVTSLSRYSLTWSFDVSDILESSNVRSFYVIFRAINAAGLHVDVPVKVINDVTPPSVEAVTVVTSPKPGFHDAKQQCQTADDFLEVLVTGVNDPESGINSLELALGSSSGLSDVIAFRQWRVVNGMYAMENLALSPGSVVYVTAKVTNNVGLYVIGASDAVVISPEPRLEVKDGPGDTDMDGQTEVHLLQGSWTYSDPCPVLQVEWAVMELGGRAVINFTTIPDNNRHFYNDRLSLQNFKTYVNYVRLRDALHRTRMAYSDGVTVLVRLPDTATVRDGLGTNDVDYQQSTDTLSANWDSFGDAQSTLPSDHIISYAAAVGTDRTLSTSRSDVHSFEDVELATNITFYGLNLTAKVQTYYITVRAYSAAGSYVESSSDGIRAGFSGGVTAGRVAASDFQSSNRSIRFSWMGFDSDMVITHYYAGISSADPSWDNVTQECSFFLNQRTSFFDLRPLQILTAESVAVVDNLALQHGSSYFVTVVAADKMGHCSAASKPVMVDLTPPVEGRVSAGGFNADTVIFIHSAQAIEVNLDDFPDPESGVARVTVDLISSTSCSPDISPDSIDVIRSVDAKNQSVISIRNLELQENTLYFVRVTVTNGAGLDTKITSRPILLDTQPPLPGLVKLGEDWTAADRIFQRHTDSVSAMLALQSFQSQQECTTQLSLLSPSFRQNWTNREGVFTPDCVGFDRSGLHVIVQHDPHLSRVDRGAAQFTPMSWREGDYHFRLSPAYGVKILTGISLASADLQPPFQIQNGLLPGNQSSPPCDPSEGLCLQDRNKTIEPGSTGSVSDFGTGLTFMENEGEVKLLFWAQDVQQLKQTWISLDFSPAATVGDYILRLRKRRESGSELWEVIFLVNGLEKASISGLIFSGHFVMSVYTWNMENYFPPVVDQFTPFKVVTVVHSLSLPVAERPLCSHGSPFRDLTSDIKEVWVGVSDGYNDTANVAPYRLVKSFCVPCLQHCDHICSSCQGDRLSQNFTVMSFKLDGLQLQAADKVFANSSQNSNSSASSDDPFNNSTVRTERSEFQLPTYHLDVLVLDHSGLETRVKSLGLLVDTSPPVFKSLRCFNPEFSKDVEVSFLGNNHTVGVTWDVSEDISVVREIKVRLGTLPGLDDISSRVTIRQTEMFYIFTDLETLLQEGGTYYVTIEAVNEAGLVSETYKNFTVLTSPPDMSLVRIGVSNVTLVSIGNVTVGLMETTDKLELSLDNDQTMADHLDVEYYELVIGTREGKGDIFPRTIVGRKGARKVTIVYGYVHRDDMPGPISVGDYTKKNYSTNDLPNPSANLFRMEPGRCLLQKLYGVSKAHVSTSLDVTPICIKRPNDLLLPADNVTHVLRQNGSSFVVDGLQTDHGTFRISLKLRKGAVIVGVLTTTDLEQEYGTSASAEFSPFVIRPDPDVNPASRWLRNRLVNVPGPSVFVSPVAEAEFADDLTLKYHVPSTVLVPEDSAVLLVFWNPYMKEWEVPEEICSSSRQTYNNITRDVSAKFCPKLFSEAIPTDSQRLGARHDTVLGPRMLTLAVVRPMPINTPPMIQNMTFSLLEDHGIYNVTLTYTDPEGDEVSFRLTRESTHGSAHITPEGKLTYVPHTNFNGMDTIYVHGEEILTSSAQDLGLVPNVINFTVTINIAAVNDPPDILYLPVQNDSIVRQEVAYGPTAGNGLNMTIYIEANKTTQPVLGFIVFSDVDVNDVKTYSNHTVLQAGAQFIESDVSLNDSRFVNSSVKQILLNISRGFTGHVTYAARVRDEDVAYSKQLTLNVFVLINPCFNGKCQPRDPQGTCYEPRRTFTFDPYTCQCHQNNEGQLCEVASNACNSSPCGPTRDCVDLPDGYRCEPNLGKALAALLNALLG